MKLSKLIRLSLNFTPKFYFGGSSLHKSSHDHHDPHHSSHEHTSHHNEAPPSEFYRPIPPYAGEVTEKQYQQFDYLLSRPTVEESTYSAHNILATFPLTKTKGFINFIATQIQQNKTVSETEAYVAPSVHENGVFLYQAKDLANEVRKMGGLEAVFFGLVAFLMDSPLFVVPVYSVWYLLMGRVFIYEFRNRFVTRMDLLPHIESIQYQKITFFGNTYNKIARIEDLEKVEYEDVEKKENWFWAANKTNVDQHMIFRDKTNGEYLLFDRQGVWNWKGISHELIN